MIIKWVKVYKGRTKNLWTFYGLLQQTLMYISITTRNIFCFLNLLNQLNSSSFFVIWTWWPLLTYQIHIFTHKSTTYSLNAPHTYIFIVFGINPICTDTDIHYLLNTANILTNERTYLDKQIFKLSTLKFLIRGLQFLFYFLIFFYLPRLYIFGKISHLYCFLRR